MRVIIILVYHLELLHILALIRRKRAFFLADAEYILPHLRFLAYKVIATLELCVSIIVATTTMIPGSNFIFLWLTLSLIKIDDVVLGSIFLLAMEFHQDLDAELVI